VPGARPAAIGDRRRIASTLRLTGGIGLTDSERSSAAGSAKASDHDRRPEQLSPTEKGRSGLDGHAVAVLGR